MRVTFLCHLLLQHTGAAKLLCCVGTPGKCSTRPAESLVVLVSMVMDAVDQRRRPLCLALLLGHFLL